MVALGSNKNLRVTLLAAVNFRLLDRSCSECIPEDYVAGPDPVDDLLNGFLAQELPRSSDSCNLESIQPGESGGESDIFRRASIFVWRKWKLTCTIQEWRAFTWVRSFLVVRGLRVSRMRAVCSSIGRPVHNWQFIAQPVDGLTLGKMGDVPPGYQLARQTSCSIYATIIVILCLGEVPSQRPFHMSARECRVRLELRAYRSALTMAG